MQDLREWLDSLARAASIRLDDYLSICKTCFNDIYGHLNRNFHYSYYDWFCKVGYNFRLYFSAISIGVSTKNGCQENE